MKHTLLQSATGLDPIAALESKAKSRGLTIEQSVAASYVQGIASKLSAKAKAVCANQQKALVALQSIATIEFETHNELDQKIETLLVSLGE